MQVNFRIGPITMIGRRILLEFIETSGLVFCVNPTNDEVPEKGMKNIYSYAKLILMQKDSRMLLTRVSGYFSKCPDICQDVYILGLESGYWSGCLGISSGVGILSHLHLLKNYMSNSTQRA